MGGRAEGGAMRKPLKDTTVKGGQKMKVALGRTLTATPVDRDAALEARLARVESVDRDLEARVAHVESQQLAELDRVDQLEQGLADASAHAAQQLKSQDTRMRSIQLAELDRVDNLEQELRNAQAIECRTAVGQDSCP